MCTVVPHTLLKQFGSLLTSSLKTIQSLEVFPENVQMYIGISSSIEKQFSYVFEQDQWAMNGNKEEADMVKSFVMEDYIFYSWKEWHHNSICLMKFIEVKQVQC